jgi:hypothetical protein
MGKCRICGGEEFEKIPPIKIKLPTPYGEIVIGGKSPTYSATVELPFVVCKHCRIVIYPKKV